MQQATETPQGANRQKARAPCGQVQRLVRQIHVLQHLHTIDKTINPIWILNRLGEPHATKCLFQSALF